MSSRIIELAPPVQHHERFVRGLSELRLFALDATTVVAERTDRLDGPWRLRAYRTLIDGDVRVEQTDVTKLAVDTARFDIIEAAACELGMRAERFAVRHAEQAVFSGRFASTAPHRRCGVGRDDACSG